MTLFIALHHTHDRFWFFLDASRATLIPGTLQTLNLLIFYQGSLTFSDVILVSNYHSYKEKEIKLLPYHSFYGGYIPHQVKLSPLFRHSASKNGTSPDAHLAASPKKFQTSSIMEFATFHIKYVWLLLLLCRIYIG